MRSQKRKPQERTLAPWRLKDASQRLGALAVEEGFETPGVFAVEKGR
jgi:hypothetical protein